MPIDSYHDQTRLKTSFLKAMHEVECTDLIIIEMAYEEALGEYVESGRG